MSANTAVKQELFSFNTLVKCSVGVLISCLVQKLQHTGKTVRPGLTIMTVHIRKYGMVADFLSYDGFGIQKKNSYFQQDAKTICQEVISADVILN